MIPDDFQKEIEQRERERRAAQDEKFSSELEEVRRRTKKERTINKVVRSIAFVGWLFR